MAFLSFGERDHDIAVIKVPDDQPVGSSGLAHTALEIEGGQEQLRELYERLKNYGAKVEFTADHVLTKSVYFFDPDGNRLEIFSQELPPADAKQFLHSIIENIPIAVVVKDAATRKLVLVNRAYEVMRKVSRLEVLGKSVFEIYRTKDAERIDASDNEALDDRQVRPTLLDFTKLGKFYVPVQLDDRGAERVA